MRPPIGATVVIPPGEALYAGDVGLIERDEPSYCVIIRFVGGCKCYIAKFCKGDPLFGRHVFLTEDFFDGYAGN